jgi:hypothetical protein
LTIANKVAQTLASCEGVAANLKSFALETEDEQAKQLYQQLAQTMDNAISQIRNRLEYAMSEEPQYRQEIGDLYPPQGNSANSHPSPKE